MIEKLKVVMNQKEIDEYNTALLEFETPGEAAYNGYHKVKEKFVDGQFFFHIEDVVRAWAIDDKITLDFGDETVIYLDKTENLMNMLNKKFKNEEN